MDPKTSTASGPNPAPTVKPSIPTGMNVSNGNNVPDPQPSGMDLTATSGSTLYTSTRMGLGVMDMNPTGFSLNNIAATGSAFDIKDALYSIYHHWTNGYISNATNVGTVIWKISLNPETWPDYFKNWSILHEACIPELDIGFVFNGAAGSVGLITIGWVKDASKKDFSIEEVESIASQTLTLGQTVSLSFILRDIRKYGMYRQTIKDPEPFPGVVCIVSSPPVNVQRTGDTQFPYVLKARLGPGAVFTTPRTSGIKLYEEYKKTVPNPLVPYDPNYNPNPPPPPEPNKFDVTLDNTCDFHVTKPLIAEWVTEVSITDRIKHIASNGKILQIEYDDSKFPKVKDAALNTTFLAANEDFAKKFMEEVVDDPDLLKNSLKNVNGMQESIGISAMHAGYAHAIPIRRVLVAYNGAGTTPGFLEDLKFFPSKAGMGLCGRYNDPNFSFAESFVGFTQVTPFRPYVSRDFPWQITKIWYRGDQFIAELESNVEWNFIEGEGRSNVNFRSHLVERRPYSATWSIVVAYPTKNPSYNKEDLSDIFNAYNGSFIWGHTPYSVDSGKHPDMQKNDYFGAIKPVIIDPSTGTIDRHLSINSAFRPTRDPTNNLHGDLTRRIIGDNSKGVDYEERYRWQYMFIGLTFGPSTPIQKLSDNMSDRFFFNVRASIPSFVSQQGSELIIEKSFSPISYSRPDSHSLAGFANTYYQFASTNLFNPYFDNPKVSNGKYLFAHLDNVCTALGTNQIVFNLRYGNTLTICQLSYVKDSNSMYVRATDHFRVMRRLSNKYGFTNFRSSTEEQLSLLDNSEWDSSLTQPKMEQQVFITPMLWQQMQERQDSRDRMNRQIAANQQYNIAVAQMQASDRSNNESRFDGFGGVVDTPTKIDATSKVLSDTVATGWKYLSSKGINNIMDASNNDFTPALKPQPIVENQRLGLTSTVGSPEVDNIYPTLNKIRAAQNTNPFRQKQQYPDDLIDFGPIPSAPMQTPTNSMRGTNPFKTYENSNTLPVASQTSSNVYDSEEEELDTSDAARRHAEFILQTQNSSNASQLNMGPPFSKVTPNKQTRFLNPLAPWGQKAPTFPSEPYAGLSPNFINYLNSRIGEHTSNLRHKVVNGIGKIRSFGNIYSPLKLNPGYVKF